MTFGTKANSLTTLVWKSQDDGYVFYIDDHDGELKMHKVDGKGVVNWREAIVIAANVDTFTVWYHAWHPKVDRSIITVFYMRKDDGRVMIREFDTDQERFSDEFEHAGHFEMLSSSLDGSRTYRRIIAGMVGQTLGKYYVTVGIDPIHSCECSV